MAPVKWRRFREVLSCSSETRMEGLPSRMTRMRWRNESPIASTPVGVTQ